MYACAPICVSTLACVEAKGQQSYLSIKLVDLIIKLKLAGVLCARGMAAVPLHTGHSAEKAERGRLQEPEGMEDTKEIRPSRQEEWCTLELTETVVACTGLHGSQPEEVPVSPHP